MSLAIISGKLFPSDLAVVAYWIENLERPKSVHALYRHAHINVQNIHCD